jgi:hypothetical protein
MLLALTPLSKPSPESHETGATICQTTASAKQASPPTRAVSFLLRCIVKLPLLKEQPAPCSARARPGAQGRGVARGPSQRRRNRRARPRRGWLRTLLIRPRSFRLWQLLRRVADFWIGRRTEAAEINSRPSAARPPGGGEDRPPTAHCPRAAQHAMLTANRTSATGRVRLPSFLVLDADPLVRRFQWLKCLKEDLLKNGAWKGAMCETTAQG